MKYLIAVFLCITSLSLTAQETEDNQINALENIASKVNSSKVLNSIQKLGVENYKFSNDNYAINPQAKAHKKSIQKEKIYANSAYISTSGGFTFHIGEYHDVSGNYRVVTCLDGYLKGLQSIFKNGVILMDSTTATWHDNYFIHYYPGGKVTSYPTKQIIEGF